MPANTPEPLNEQEDRDLADKVTRLETERELMLKLVDAGASDMEAALLVGMSRMTQDDGCDAEAVVSAMKREKTHLFRDDAGMSDSEPPIRTGGARRKGSEHTSALARAAKRAATTGSRCDLQQYLRLRRSR